MKPLSDFLRSWLATASAGVVALIAACSSTPVSKPPEPVAGAANQGVAAPHTASISRANNPFAYRQDAARHLYAQNAHRIFKGKLPPHLYAIGVLQIEVDGKGRVAGFQWMRAPQHAPEVVAEIERTVRLAAPFPVPVELGRVTYTDTWLWDRSDRFQLDTLTEGQL